MCQDNFVVTMTPNRLDDFKKLVAKFNKRAAKHTTDEIEIHSVVETVKKYDGVAHEVIEVTINRPRFALGDYQIDAVHSIEHGYEVTFEYNGYSHDHTSTVDFGRCDHCGKKRNRHTVLKVTNGEGHLQVGSTCVKDFMGVSLTEFKWFNERLREVYSDDWEEGGASAPRAYLVEDVLALSYMACVKDGYKNKDSQCPTSVIVRDMIMKGTKTTHDAKAWAIDAIELIGSIVPTNTYQQNIFNIAQSEYVGTKHLNLLVSAYVLVEAEKEKRRGDNGKVSQHIGNIKERITFRGRIKLVYSSPSAFGLRVMYIFVDESGNELKWSTTSPDHIDYEKDSKWVVTGTVKEHDEYRGVKQTIITRCKMEEITE